MISSRSSFWESSRRPLYPKWVWSDGVGHRHFIIDHDIRTVTKISRTSKNKSFMTKSASFDVIGDNNATVEEVRRMSAVDGTPIVKKNVGRRGICTPKPSVNFLRRELNRRLDVNHANIDKTSSESEINSNSNAVDAKTNQKNPLADRVINWLDLAGLNTLIRTTENHQTIEKTPTRRVCTTESVLQRPSLQSGTRFSAPLRRSESIHMLSLTFNDIEGPHSEKSTFNSAASAQRTSHHALLAAHQNLVNNKSGGKNINNPFSDGTDSNKGHLGARSRHPGSAKPLFNRKSSSASGVSNDDIEKQYRSLIQRQILEKSCNIQAARRQLHIFMPSLPDKNLLTAGGLGVEDGDSSHLSTILSSGI